MIVRRLLAIAAAGLIVTGCSNTESAVTDTASAAERSTDAQPELVPPVDSPVAADSMLPPPSDATGNLTGETRSRDPVIGRDSAFGPIGTMDSDGTVRPIKK